MFDRFSSTAIANGIVNFVGGFILFLISACVVIPPVAFAVGAALTFVSCSLFLSGAKARDVSPPNFTPTVDLLGWCVLAVSLMLLLHGGAFASII